MASYDGTIKIDTKIDSKGLNKLGSLAKGALGGVGAAVTAAGSALAGLGGAAIKIGSDFEAAMSRVQAISGATEEEFAQLNELAKQLGADTAFSASEAAEGMENLASAGFATSEIMDAMPGLLDLAAASGADLGAATEIAASALRGFGLDASEAGHVADVFADAANKTNAQVEDMGEAMKYIAPVANAMGQSLEDTAAAVGILSDAGIKGSQAGTSLRSMLSSLARPSLVASKAMEEYGLSFYDAQGNMLSLAGIITELQGKLGGLTQEQRNNALVSIFGQEALSGVLALMDRGAEELTSLSGEFQNSAGAAKEASEIMLDNFSGAVEEMKGSAETLGIEIYESVQEPLKSLAQEGTLYLNQLTSAFQTGGLSGLVASLGGVLADIAARVAEAAPQFVSLGVSLLQSLLQGIAGSAESIASAAAQVVTTLTTAILENLPLLLETALQMLAALVQGIAQSLPTLIPAAVDCVLALVDGLTNNLDMLVDAAIELVASLAQGVIYALPRLIEQAPVIIQRLVDALIENDVKLFEAAYEIIVALVQGIIQNLPQLIEAAFQIVGTLIAGLFEKAGELFQAGLTIIQNIWDAVTSIDWIQLGKDIIGGIINGIKKMAGALWDALVGAVSSAFDAVKDFFGINSPSKLMRDEVGKMLPPGIAVGFEDAIPAAERKMLEGYEHLVRRMEAAAEASTLRNLPDIDISEPPKPGRNGAETRNITQINNFNQPVQSPAQTARAVKKAGRDLLSST